MTGWDATLYRRFEADRTRPARDLLDGLPRGAFTRIVDLGCGPGNSTALLKEAFSQAVLTGVDNDPDMLTKAGDALPDVGFLSADIGAWVREALESGAGEGAEAPDLIFANASLHWLPDHETLFPQLLSCLAPGGVLAVQMPDNLEEPSHRLMREVASGFASGDYGREAMAGREVPGSAADYYRWLIPGAESVDVRRICYHHVMPDAGAICDWVRGAGLRPFLSPLSGSEQEAFLARYLARLEEEYPSQPDGNRLFAFPRLFITARKKPAA